jgi:hypothetical protein
MRSRMKAVCLTTLLLFLGACASLEDFQNMSPDERAQKVCEGSSAYAGRARSLRQLSAEIAEKEDLLAHGYRVYEQCQIVAFTVPGNTVDCGNATGEALQNCQQGNTPPTTERRKVCMETRVPIDYAYESSALRDLRMSRESLDEQHEQLTYACQARVESMPAARAFSLYKDDLEY